MELSTYLPYLVNRLGQRFVSEITPALNKAGVNIQSWRVLIALYQGGKQTVGDLSELTSINFSTLSRVLDRMEDKNLARRQRGAVHAARRRRLGASDHSGARCSPLQGAQECRRCAAAARDTTQRPTARQPATVTSSRRE